jgi:LPXTG-motif cell wall-anchored protein
MFCSTGRFLVLAAAVCALLARGAAAQVSPIVSGYNMSTAGENVDVPFNIENQYWAFEADLIFDPTAPPMTKFFETPRDPTGAPIQLDALQPLPFTIWEFFNLFPGLPGGPPASWPVADWHEEILTPGWVWVLPGDPQFPGLFPPGESLITRNGEPWPWSFIPHPDGQTDPSRLWVEFPGIGPGNVLDIHKALLWVGTDTQRIWGDDPTETGIVVLEYPTPEPSSFVLGGVALAGLCGWAWRKKRKT